jgi:hypothetical protein
MPDAALARLLVGSALDYQFVNAETVDVGRVAVSSRSFCRVLRLTGVRHQSSINLQEVLN